MSDTRRAELYQLLGELPPRDLPISARAIRIEPHDEYIMERLALELNGIESVPALFVKPKTGAKFPCVVFNHSHGGNYVSGKDELINGREYLHPIPYAVELARAGIAALCIDHWGFGERRGRTESELFKHMLWHGRVLFGMMVYDSLRAVDYLHTRADVDATRIATLGLSLGSTMAQWLAALDTRIRACVDLCCLTDYQALIDARGLDGHGIYYYVPRLLLHFTAAQINALIAPRPHLALEGNQDRLTPPAGLDRIDAELKRVYAQLGASEAWQMKRYEIGHFETADMRAEVMRFLRQQFF
jgi:dienelactone hydrolase